MKSIAVILGSAFDAGTLGGMKLESVEVKTKFGEQKLYRVRDKDRTAYIIFRHGLPHHLLPNQINCRAQAAALRELDCGALLVTSSVGVLDAEVPLDTPMLLSDLIMQDNRLPDGTSCTMFVDPDEEQGHLVIKEGLFSSALGRQVGDLCRGLSVTLGPEVVFAYVSGPRTKTPSENRMWARLGAQVNSMTLAPEVVLANELEIPCAGLVVGHKYSLPEHEAPNETGLAESLERSRDTTERIVAEFLNKGEPVEFANEIYRFGGAEK